MIRVLIELRKWLQCGHTSALGERAEVHLVFPSRKEAEEVRNRTISELSGACNFPGPLGKIQVMGFPLKFKYKETIEGEV